MKVKLSFIMLSLLIILSLSFAGCQATPPQQPAAPTSPPSAKPVEPVELILAYGFPVNCTGDRGLKKYAEEVMKQSNGAVKINVISGAVLTSPVESYDGLRGGAYDMTEGCVTYTPGDFPLSGVAQLPLPGIRDNVQMANAWWEMYQTLPELQSEYKGMHVIGVAFPPPNQIMSKKPIRKVDELKGLKVRAAGFPQADMVKALGATAVPIPFGEVYPALEKGIIDVTLSTFQGIPIENLHEILNYYTMTNFGNTPMVLVMNMDSWNKLPKDSQEVFNKLSGPKYIEIWSPIWWDDENLGKKIVKDEGQEIINFSDAEIAKLNQLLKPVIGQWVDSMNSKNLPGQKVVDTYIELLKKY